MVSGGSATIARTVVEDTAASAIDELGHGIEVLSGTAHAVPSEVAIDECSVRDNVGAGVMVESSNAVIDHTLVQRTAEPARLGRMGYGVYAGVARADLGASHVDVRSSIVEESHDVGVYALGGVVSLQGSIVRDTLPATNQPVAIGVAALHHPEFALRGDVTVTQSLVEESFGQGIHVESSTLALASSVVRDIHPDPSGYQGEGIHARTHPGLARAQVTLTGSLLEQAHGFGVVVTDTDLHIDACAVRDIEPWSATSEYGRGVEVQSLEERSSATLRWSLVEHVHDAGVVGWSADVTVEGVIVRDVRPQASDDTNGLGIASFPNPERGDPTIMALRGSLVERVTTGGLVISDSELAVEDTIVRDILPRASDGDFGRCINAQAGARLSVIHSLVESCHEIGILFLSSTGEVGDTIVRDVVPASFDGLLGDGIVVLLAPADAPVAIAGTRIERAARAGVAAFGGHATLANNVIDCSLIDLAAEPFSDAPSRFTDLGGNVCGCGELTRECKAHAANLAPPAPFPEP